MSAARRPRARLPRRVYWFRRAAVLGTTLLLVFALGRVLVGGGESADETATEQARTASTTTKRPSEPPVQGPRALPPVEAAAGQVRTPVLAAPDGPCREEEITAVPLVPEARGGGRIQIAVQLTSPRPACTFEASPDSLVVKITSGKDRIWTSQECRAGIPSGEVVVRSVTPTVVPVTWSGRRSDEDCSRHTSWALPGFYHVMSAVLGSNPSAVQFEVVAPPRPIVTKTAKPKKRGRQVPGAQTPGAQAPGAQPAPTPGTPPASAAPVPQADAATPAPSPKPPARKPQRRASRPG